MLRRWLYHYELSNAMVRLVTLTVINWSVSAFVSSYYGDDQPIWKWMTICSILLVCNVCKIMLANNKNYHKTMLNHKSTVVRVLVLPLSIVVVLTMLATMHQVSQLRSQALLETVQSAGVKHAELADAEIRVMIFVLSAWTPKSITKRQTFRETTLTLKPQDSPKISFFYRFILGEPPTEEKKRQMGPAIEAEMAAHQDLLILPCSDKYEDLSKKVFSTIEWADQYAFDYLIKTDDDIFARWDTISEELVALGRTERYWQGLSYY
ncbi:hypothetical protein BCR43DRAFT_404520, partial [Syncephalastrum racemosum]